MKGKMFCIMILLILILGSISYVGQNNTTKAIEITKEKSISFTKELEKKAEYEDWTFSVDENSATSYSIDQLCGLKEPENWQHYVEFDDMISATTMLPDSYDWRDKNGVTSIKNQGSCGSCWAFATAGVLESAIKIKSGSTVDLSEQWLVSCNKDGWGCNGGWWAHPYHAGKTGRCGGTGAVLESNFPYTASNKPCSGPYGHNYILIDSNGDGSSWKFVGGQNSLPSVEQIKQAIYDHGPVGVAVYVDSAFQAYNGGVFNGNGNGRVNHAVILVGWDDDQGEDGVWFLKNSWGSSWGENGYMRIEYGRNSVGYSANYIDSYEPLDPNDDDITISLTMNKLTNEGMDPIDLIGAPEWYYRVGLKSGSKVTYQENHNKQENPEEPGSWFDYAHEHTWNIQQDHIFYPTTQTVEVTIKLMEFDDLIPFIDDCDLADVSAYSGGGVDNNIADVRGAIYHGSYNLVSDELTGDKTNKDGSYFTTMGEGANNAKVWFKVTDSYDAEKYEPNINVEPTKLDYGEVSKDSNARKDLSITNIAPNDPFNFADELEWSASADESWISLSKKSGSLEGGETNEITVSLDTSGMSKGNSYSGNIKITSNDEDKNIKVTVSITKARYRHSGSLIDMLKLKFPLLNLI